MGERRVLFLQSQKRVHVLELKHHQQLVRCAVQIFVSECLKKEKVRVVRCWLGPYESRVRTEKSKCLQDLVLWQRWVQHHPSPWRCYHRLIYQKRILIMKVYRWLSTWNRWKMHKHTGPRLPVTKISRIYGRNFQRRNYLSVTVMSPMVIIGCASEELMPQGLKAKMQLSHFH